VPFQLGLVVGKFSPLHLGHEWLIMQAGLQCQQLLILSYSNPEIARCQAPIRRQWFAARFPQHETYVIDDPWLQRKCQDLRTAPRPLPDNGSSDTEQQHFLAWLLRDVLTRKPDAIFCSESYGATCAKVLTRILGQPVQAVILDLDRNHVPVSATQIRQSPHKHREWMAPEVASAFVHRIALLGGESSGKTTLAAALAERYGTLWVHEYGRELWELQKGVMSADDLLKIGYEQIHREEAAMKRAQRFLFCDTSPLTTAGYGLWMFGHIDPQLAKLAARSYDAAILCKPDFPFVQDGSRREEAFRDQQQAWYQDQITTLKYPVLEVGGSVSERLSLVASWLDTLGLL
jgi:HTH-type transcriptional regulator, transcriptional repressor of NAD biosynthesis genes